MQETSFPTEFVWTKFGTESGEQADEIFARKESERTYNGGIFLWGIGNNVGPSINVLSKNRSPELLFSPILSPARQCDEEPEKVVRWTSAESLDGQTFDIPQGSFVTSRWSPKKRFHYALVCFSEIALCNSKSHGHICSGSLRNLVSGKQVGSSQVTSVVERDTMQCIGRRYTISMRIKLVAPYLVRLFNPITITRDEQIAFFRDRR